MVAVESTWGSSWPDVDWGSGDVDIELWGAIPSPEKTKAHILTKMMVFKVFEDSTSMEINDDHKSNARPTLDRAFLKYT